MDDNVKDFLDRFSFSDFAAYFVPGSFFLMGLFPLLLLTGASNKVLSFLGNLDFGRSAALLVLAYVSGAILSGFSHFLMRVFYAPLGFFRAFKDRNLRGNIPQGLKSKDPRDTVCPCVFEDQIRSAFSAVLGLKCESQASPGRVSANASDAWTRDHFYLVRLLIDQFMPRPALVARRQNSLRIFRENMIVPSLVWILAGFLWSRELYDSADPKGGSLLLSISVVSLLLVPGVLSYRSRRNREREVREIYLALFVGHKLGIFESKLLDDGSE
jgi:hypothetical protein